MAPTPEIEIEHHADRAKYWIGMVIANSSPRQSWIDAVLAQIGYHVRMVCRLARQRRAA